MTLEKYPALNLENEKFLHVFIMLRCLVKYHTVWNYWCWRSSSMPS